MARRLDEVLASITSIDYGRVEGYLVSFIQDSIKEASVDGAVIGLSGGVDSSTTYALLVRAIGSSRVKALVMPDTSVTPKEDVEDAVSLAKALGSRYDVIDIKPLVDAYKKALPVYEDEQGPDRIPLGNLRARIRMNLLYYYANKENRIVVGTGDRSEILIGYFTKYGDGACDIMPLAVLYKSQVRRLALHLGIPQKIAFKPSSPRLWRGHEAEKELGLSYDLIDAVLHLLFDKGMSPERVSEYLEVPRSIVDRVLGLHRRSEHKRSLPGAPTLEPILGMMG
ncbi:MAG: NAD+ synthase [Desulfurococcales archaeon]|nr:NAD+ synthase [Desulfurococcales archaeon]